MPSFSVGDSVVGHIPATAHVQQLAPGSVVYGDVFRMERGYVTIKASDGDYYITLPAQHVSLQVQPTL